MNERRLEQVRERAKFRRGAAASGAAHDHDAAGRIDPAGDFGNIRRARGKLGPWLQGGNAGHAAVGLGGGDILRQRQMGDAAARIGGRDRLMNDAGRLRRRRYRLRVERHVAEQQIGLGGLDVVGAVHLARHVARERQYRGVIPARFIQAGDEMGAAGTGRAGTDREPPGELGLAGGREGRAFLMPDADPLNAVSTRGVRQRVQGIADQSKYLFDPNLRERSGQNIRNRL